MLVPSYAGFISGEEHVVLVLDSETKNSFFMTSPRSFISKNNYFKIYDFKITADNRLFLYSPAYGGHVLEYVLDNNLHKNPVQFFKDNIKQLAFYNILKDEEDNLWEGHAGLKDDVFAMFYPSSVLPLIHNAWVLLSPIDIERFESNISLMDGTDRNILCYLCKFDSHVNDYHFIEIVLNWYELWDRMVQSFSSYSYNIVNSRFLELEKRFFLVKAYRKGVKKTPEIIKKYFPDGCKGFNEENYEKIANYIKESSKVIKWVTNSVCNKGIDNESTIMSALSHGEGDSFGF